MANEGDKLIVEVKGLTIRQWADKITSGEYQPVKHGHWIEHPDDIKT